LAEPGLAARRPAVVHLGDEILDDHDAGVPLQRRVQAGAAAAKNGLCRVEVMMSLY
jgi:hypothetical protein